MTVDYTKPSTFRDHGDGSLPPNHYVVSCDRFFTVASGRWETRITLILPDDLDFDKPKLINEIVREFRKELPNEVK